MAQHRHIGPNRTKSTHPVSGEVYTRTFDEIDYYSNRENGQVVKRESPMVLTKASWNADLPPFGDAGPQDTIMAYPAASYSPTSTGAYTKAYRKMKRELESPTSEMLLNIVERNKSLEMVAARAFQLKQLVSSTIRGRFGDAWNYMSLNPDSSLLDLKNRRRRDSRFVSGKARQRSGDEARRHRQILKDIGQLLLEVRYGWSPLMQDIQSAVEVLTKPNKPQRVVVRATANSTQTRAYGSLTGTLNVSDRVTLRGTLTTTNPALDLANRLGFVNLASVVWEQIPFSFLFDWAVPIGPFLSSLTDFLGVSLTDASVTGRQTVTCAKIPYSAWPFAALAFVGSGYYIRQIRTVGFSSFPTPPLVWGSGLSPGRAINAIALLLTTLSPRKAATNRLAG